MLFEVLLKVLEYIFHVVKGFVEILIGKEEFIYDEQGKIISKLPSKRKQVLVFLKNFLKEPVRVERIEIIALSCCRNYRII